MVGSSQQIAALEDLPPEIEIIGAKALGLRRLSSKSNVTIPPTAVIPAHVYERMLQSDSRSPEEILRILDSIDLTALSREVREYCLAHFGDVRLAIRSSSNIEDLNDKSFSGQYDSVVDVSLAEIEPAIRCCWKSLWSDHACAYRQVTDRRPRMALIVQPFIHGMLSGVAFSVNPLTGSPFEIIFNYRNGDCSSVTAGDATDCKVYLLKTAHLLLGHPVPEPFKSIAEIFVSFTDPVDIEWSVDTSGTIYILQVRPVAAKMKFGLDGRFLQKFELSFPETFSPLGTSLEFQKNRIYNSVLRRLINPLFKHRRISVYNRLFHSVDSRNSTYGPCALVWKLLIALSKSLRYLTMTRSIKQIAAIRVPSEPHEVKGRLLSLLRLYLEFYEASVYVGFFRNTCLSIFVQYTHWATRYAFGKDALRRLLLSSNPRSIVRVRDNRLRSLAEGFSDFDSEDWLALQAPGFQKRFERYRNEFGYVFSDTYPRDPYSRLDLDVARNILRNFKNLPVQETDVTILRAIEQKMGERRVGWAYLLSFRFFRWIFLYLGPVREERNHYLYLFGSGIRKFIELNSRSIRAGYGLSSPDDIYFLSMAELNKGAASPKLVRLRKVNYLLSRNLVDPYPRKLKKVSTLAIPEKNGTRLRGIPCSPGVATGPLVFLRTREDFARVRPGAVLVAHNLRPFWTPVLKLAAGLLGSAGNVLSHGASIAREYGVPAVFGLGEEIFELGEGQIVCMNGTTGEVFITQGDSSFEPH